MSSSTFRVLSDDERAQMRQWLENWRVAGESLERERYRRIAAMTDEEAWLESQGLFEWWEPGMTGDAGEGLLLQQQVFARWSHGRRRP